MKIAIDGRFWGLENTGLGRYTMGLIYGLKNATDDNTYYLLLRKKWFDQFKSLKLSAKFVPILADAKHYSLKEQLLIPKILWRIKPDLFHALHFNIPIIWRGKMVVTIHDLITQFSIGSQSTTLPKYLYWIKWHMHNQVLLNAINKSKAIITPSQFTKQQILNKYETNERKIYVTYEGVDNVYWNKSYLNKTINEKYLLGNFPYIVYTGNVYPHKNIEVLLDGLRIYNLEKRNSCHLLVICSRSVFASRLEKLVKIKKMQDVVHFLGFVPDTDLREIYSKSMAFVTPSKLEGFGLPGLEAMASGTLVLAANSSCLPEIYKKAAWYFDPDSADELANALINVSKLDTNSRKNMIKNAQNHAREFNWDKLAKETLNIYSSAL